MRKIEIGALVVFVVFIVVRRYTRARTPPQRCGWCETGCVLPPDERQHCPFRASAELLRLALTDDKQDLPDALWENEQRWLNLGSND